MTNEKVEDKGKIIFTLLERTSPTDISKSVLREKKDKKNLNLIIIKTAKKIAKVTT
jgi:hypothetical protein